MRIPFWPIACLFSILCFISCGKKAKKKSPPTTVSTIFIQGDPNNIIKGSTLEKDSFINAENFHHFNGFYLYSVQEFTNQAIIKKEELEAPNSIESGNESPEDDEINNLQQTVENFNFVKNKDKFFYTDKGKNIKFNFSLQDNKLIIDSLFIYQEYQIDALHYSLKKDKSAFSILGMIRDGENNSLISFTFIKKIPAIKTETLDSKYQYLMGPGVKVAWAKNETLQFNICGKQSIKVLDAYIIGLEAWNYPLGNEFKIEHKVLTKYPPFSDLNSHCLYTINHYLRIPNEKAAEVGITFPIIDIFKKEIIDSDIFIWVKENEKLYSDLESANDLSVTVAHEMGHVLGLHHQFDKNIESVMSYSNTNYITPYDYNAIRELYEVKEKSKEEISEDITSTYFKKSTNSFHDSSSASLL